MLGLPPSAPPPAAEPSPPPRPGPLAGVGGALGAESLYPLGAASALPSFGEVRRVQLRIEVGVG